MALQDAMARYRAERNIGQAQAAHDAGISLQTWCNVERGVQNPSRLTAAKIKILLEKGGKHEGINIAGQNI